MQITNRMIENDHRTILATFAAGCFSAEVSNKKNGKREYWLEVESMAHEHTYYSVAKATSGYRLVKLTTEDYATGRYCQSCNS